MAPNIKYHTTAKRRRGAGRHSRPIPFQGLSMTQRCCSLAPRPCPCPDSLPYLLTRTCAPLASEPALQHRCMRTPDTHRTPLAPRNDRPSLPRSISPAQHRYLAPRTTIAYRVPNPHAAPRLHPSYCPHTPTHLHPSPQPRRLASAAGKLTCRAACEI